MDKMTKKTKNIVMIAAAVLLAVSMVVTVSFAAKSGGDQMGPPGMQNQQMQQGDQKGQPPAPPSGDQNNQNGGQSSDQNNNGQSGQNSNDQNGQNNNGQPPAPPNADQNNQSGGPSSDQNSNGQSGQNSNDQNGQNNNGQPPAPPNGDQNSQNGGQNNGNQQKDFHKSKGGNHRSRIASIDGKYYGLLGAESLAFALIVLYLIMSKMNSRTFRETFKTRCRIVAFLLAAVLATGCMTQTEAAVSRYIATNSMTTQQQDQGPGGPGQNSGDQNQGPGGDGQNQAPGGADQGTQAEATGATTVDGKKETLNKTYTSTKADENAILVTGGGTLTSDGATINKKSGDSSNTGSSDFSGVNAALLVNDNSTATVKNAKITTSAKGANGVFATGEKSKITISDSSITTTGEASSRGLDATYGGTIEATNVTIKTQGGSCAAMATDRGEGTVTATKSTLETNGAGSPVIYSTGNISMTDSTGKANGAQITVVEGKNSATITNSKVSCSAAGNRGDVDVAGVMIYQSMSGDASEGTGNFTASDSQLSVDKDSKYYKTAPMFFVTNTDAVIKLTNTDLSFGSGTLLSAKGTSEWGNEGSNGGTVKLDAAEQTLTGDIQLDKISTLDMTLSKGSSYTGTINGDKSAKSIKLTLDKTSKIKLTGDSYVTELEDADTSYSNIDFNGHTLYVNGKAVKGN